MGEKERIHYFGDGMGICDGFEVHEDFVNARNGSVVIEELPSYLAFFNKYVTAAQAVRIASLHTDCIHSAACFRLSAPNSTLAPVSPLPLSFLQTLAARNYHP